MTDKSSSQTFEDLQMSEVKDNTPEELIKYNPQPLKSINNSWKFNIRRCMFLIFILISSSILVFQITAKDKVSADDLGPFQSYVYCPYSYKDRATQIQGGNEQLRRLYQSSYGFKISLAKSVNQPSYDWNNTYVVEMRSKLDVFNKAGASLEYCGFATPYYSTCDQDVKFVCSSPGPMFDLTVQKHTDVVWINNLNPRFVPSNSCMTNSTPHCQLTAKQTQYLSMTFNDPTEDHDQTLSQTIKIGANNWPTSTHVHGAEVRPTFDGNPLSWIDNSGNRGVGAFSLSDQQCYYKFFDKVDSQYNDYLPPDIIVQNIEDDYQIAKAKINRYPNIQNPGNLWYHDHAMRLTLYNVQYGLSGTYILRDPEVEKQIGVDRSNENIVTMTTSGWRTSQSISLDTDTVYRFKFLNNNYGRDSIFKVQFKYGNCNTKSLPIPFTIIGADSSLFDKGIEGQTNFIIAQAERIQILILLKHQAQTYSICAQPFLGSSTNPTEPITYSLNIQNNALVDRIKSKKLMKNNRTSIQNVCLQVPFVQFSNKEDKVVVKRMRPLMKVKGTAFTINGRASYHDGASQNPKIGTYEDWYIINSIGFYHPIHIHLINFQVVKILSLRKVGTCSIYELDFVAKAFNIARLQGKYLDFPLICNEGNCNYSFICQNLTQIKELPQFNKALQKVNPENVIENKISGIDVEKDITPEERQNFKRYEIPIGQNQFKKYVTNEQNFIKLHYRKWKDTALVQTDKVYVFRIRWAKSAYKEDDPNDPYFHVPIDQLREYPGFVYHCHILNHQDNQMMRPIMLELPDDTSSINTKTPCNNDFPKFSWPTKVKCINQVQCQEIPI